MGKRYNGNRKMAQSPYANEYTDTELLEQIRMLATELGRTPKQMEFTADDRTAHHTTVVYHFGSWVAGVHKAGYKPYGEITICDKETVIQDIIMMTEVLDRVPTMIEFENCPHTCALSSVYDYFPNWRTAVEVVGYEPRNQGENTDV